MPTRIRNHHHKVLVPSDEERHLSMMIYSINNKINVIIIITIHLPSQSQILILSRVELTPTMNKIWTTFVSPTANTACTCARENPRTAQDATPASLASTTNADFFKWISAS